MGSFQTFPKPAKGTALLEKRAKRREVENFEKAEKAKVRKRDRECRWPRCQCKRLTRIPTEVAHLNDKGIGGDHGVRSTADQMMLLCVLRHQGACSLHSGDCRIEPQTEQGTNGPCDFYERAESGRMELIASERSIGVSEMRGN